MQPAPEETADRRSQTVGGPRRCQGSPPSGRGGAPPTRFWHGRMRRGRTRRETGRLRPAWAVRWAQWRHNRGASKPVCSPSQVGLGFGWGCLRPEVKRQGRRAQGCSETPAPACCGRNILAPLYGELDGDVVRRIVFAEHLGRTHKVANEVSSSTRIYRRTDSVSSIPQLVGLCC